MNIRKYSIFYRYISAPLQCWTGIILLCAFLISDGIVVRLIFTATFGLLASCAGKRIYWLYFLMICVGTVFFQLLSPIGKILFSIGPLPITDIALLLGLEKGISLSGMVFVSLFAIRKDLQIPGKFGGILVMMFAYFDSLIAHRKGLRLRHLRTDIDKLILTLYQSIHQTNHVQTQNTVLGWICSLALIAISLVLGIWSRFAI